MNFKKGDLLFFLNIFPIGSIDPLFKLQKLESSEIKNELLLKEELLGYPYIHN